MNLYVNAWQAMPGGGTLTLRTGNVAIDEGYGGAPGMPPGAYAKVSVIDTGAGMDEETVRRAFEPFFSTKGQGFGTGLGLASAYGIVRNHGGVITVTSAPGKGAAFAVYLPASGKAAVPRTPADAEVVKGGGRILIVDDQDFVLSVAEAMIRSLGYETAAARSGEEALALYSRSRGAIDLVLLDMIMPGMGGGETFDRLKAMDPGVKVILSSGYSVDGQASGILSRGCRGFIQKPFSLSDLSRKIRQVLEG